MGEYSEVFQLLQENTKTLLERDPSAEQVIAVKTARDHLYCFANHCVCAAEREDENSFIRTLAANDDTQICYVLCLWRDMHIGVPATCFTQQLIGIHAQNQFAKIFLQGFGQILAKELKATLPRKE